MKVSGGRLLFDLNELKQFTDTPGAGVSRFSYGENDRKAREYLKASAESYGFAVGTDPVGNMYMRHPEADKSNQKICIGSHIDTVRNGGWLDGIYGVVGGLEVLRTLAENEQDRLKNVELVVFAEEEGSNFGSTMTGSKFAAGIYGEKELDSLKNGEGLSLRAVLSESGYEPYKSEEVLWDFSRVKAMLELHIEQGPVLAEGKKSIGIVDTIFGMTTIEVTLNGTGNHAGASPMSYRKDALVAAAHCIIEAEQVARRDPRGVLVATVGKVAVSPNGSNVIPERVVFTLEVRHTSETVIEETISMLETAIREIAAQRDVACEITTLAASKPYQMNEDIINLIDGLALEMGVDYQRLNSGAVHDTCMIAPHVPAGMIFVPSIGGRSHVPFENTKEEDLVQGVQLLLNTVLDI